MLRRFLSAAAAAALALAVFVPVTSPASAEPTPLSAPQCWGRCSQCTAGCGSAYDTDRERCERLCFARNERCCEAAGHSSVPRNCGCD